MNMTQGMVDGDVETAFAKMIRIRKHLREAEVELRERAHQVARTSEKVLDMMKTLLESQPEGTVVRVDGKRYSLRRLSTGLRLLDVAIDRDDEDAAGQEPALAELQEVS